jgi:hypothetical protein
MTILILVPLVIYQHFSGSATVCTVVYIIGVGVLSAIAGYVPEAIVGQAIASLLLGGLYFGFLARLDKERSVYWAVMIGGGLFLVAIR